MKKLSSKVLILFTMIFCLFVAMSLTAYGAEPSSVTGQEEQVSRGAAADSDSVEIVDANGNVMGIFTPYSATNPPPAMSRFTANVNWTIDAWTSAAGSSVMTMNTSSKISLNISYRSGADSGIGLYDEDSGTYGWANWSSGGHWGGTITPTYSGRFKLAIHNNTSGKVTYTGSFSY